MDPEDVDPASGDRQRDGGGGAAETVPVDGDGALPVRRALRARDVADERLAGHPEEERGPEGAERRERAEQGEVVLEALPEADAWVHHEPIRGDPSGDRGVQSVPQAGSDLVDGVAVGRCVLHGLGRPLAMHEHQEEVRLPPQLGDGGEHPRVREPSADVVDDRGAGLHGPAGHLGLGGVHRDRRRPERAEPRDDREDPAQLLLRRDRRGAGPRRLPADVEHVGALRHQRGAVLDRPRRVEEAPPVREAVRRHVDDAHDRRGPAVHGEPPLRLVGPGRGLGGVGAAAHRARQAGERPGSEPPSPSRSSSGGAGAGLLLGVEERRSSRISSAVFSRRLSGASPSISLAISSRSRVS